MGSCDPALVTQAFVDAQAGDGQATASVFFDSQLYGVWPTHYADRHENLLRGRKGPAAHRRLRRRHDAGAGAQAGRQMLAAMRSGTDPAFERQGASAPRRGETTVAALADKWMAEYVRPKLKPRTPSTTSGCGEAHPAGARPSGGCDISHGNVERLHVDMARRHGGRTTRSRARSRTSRSCKHGLRQREQSRRAASRCTAKARERFLSDRNRAAADAIEPPSGKGRSARGAAGLRLALFTGADRVRSQHTMGTRRLGAEACSVAGQQLERAAHCSLERSRDRGAPDRAARRAVCLAGAVPANRSKICLAPGS